MSRLCGESVTNRRGLPVDSEVARHRVQHRSRKGQDWLLAESTRDSMGVPDGARSAS
jgi:hypothetical protein